MKLDNSFSIQREESYEGIFAAFEPFADVFPKTLGNVALRSAYAQKIYQFGICFVCRWNGEVLGLMTQYANDHKTKCAYGTLLAVLPKAGLLRALVWKELIRVALEYAASQGMEYMIGEVYDDNAYAMKQYCGIGFAPIGRASDQSEYIKGSIPEMLEKLGAKTPSIPFSKHQ